MNTLRACCLLLVGLLPALTGCRPADADERAPAPPTTPAAVAASAAPSVQAATPVEAGRYLVVIAGCNDCHTDGYLQTEGRVPESEWLMGSPIGWRGPWGTTYPANLRHTVQTLSEDGWVTLLRTRKALPPMPWMNVAQLSDADARAIYQYIRSLGPKGETMPAAVPSGEEPQTPYLDMTPQHLERLQTVPSAPAAS